MQKGKPLQPGLICIGKMRKGKIVLVGEQENFTVPNLQKDIFFPGWIVSKGNIIGLGGYGMKHVKVLFICFFRRKKAGCFAPLL
jgi:hypothetical protein